MAEAPRVLVMVDRDAHPHKWATGLGGTVCREPCFLAVSCCLLPCSNVLLRRDALKTVGTPYRCFQHEFLPCCGRCIPGQRACPACCLCLEAHLCPVHSALATRHMIQDKFQVRRTCVERTCMGALCICELATCCCPKDSCFHELPHALKHCCLCFVLPCMNAQGHHQLKVERRGGGLSDALVPSGGRE